MNRLVSLIATVALATTFSGCGDDTTPPPSDEITLTVDCCLGSADVENCGVDMDMGTPLPIETSLTVDLEADIASGEVVNMSSELVSLLVADVAALVALVADELTLRQFDFELGVAGSTEGSVLFEASPVPIIIPIEMDSMGNALDTEMSSGYIDGSFTHDGSSAEVVVSLDALTVVIALDPMNPSSDITLEVPTPDPAPPNTAVYCELPADAPTITFPVD